MKRKISLLLVLAMMLTLVPMSAFAASSNNVNKVPKVDDEKAFNLSDAPLLRIEEKTDGDIKTGDKFRLTLSGAGAEWNYADGDTVTGAVYSEGSVTGNTLTVKRVTSTKIDVTVVAAPTSGTTRIDFPMNVTIDGKGEAKVTIDPLDTTISAGTVTYALASNGSTIITIDKAEVVRRGDAQEGAEMVFDETAINAVEGAQKIELELPAGFEWDKAATAVDTDAFGDTTPTVTYKNDGASNEDKEVLVVEFTAAAGSSRRTLTIKPVFDVTRDARYGEVKVDIKSRTGEINSEKNIVIAEYNEYGVKLSIDEVEEFYAGRVDADYETAEIKLEEKVANSIVRNRVIEFKLPEGVQIQDAEDLEIVDADGTGFTFTYNGTGDVTKNTSQFEAEVKNAAGAEGATIKFKLPLTVEADFTGDIELTVSGAGIEEQTIVVAKAVAPLTAKVKVADVKVGLQDQAAPDIILTETEAGALREDKKIELVFDNDYEMDFDDAEFEVIEGDLKIDQDKCDVENKKLTIYVDRDSEEKSVIKVSGIKLTLDRSVPEGPFNLKVTGDAIVDNGTYNDGDFTNNLVSVKFANVITKVSSNVAIESSFVIGQSTYKVGDEERSADVAPYIADGRTMLSLRYVSEAMGVTNDNIIWDGETRTVTIFKGDRVAQVKIGSNKLFVNGVAVPMDTAAVIKDGRTMLPIRFIAQALGAEVEWDGATRTVTIK
ncbi:MAG: copper amine oxidase N-terminal domain-containing protein [Marinisporobacter sp.]|jgi:hypothetical protein|nr:copper amine oxidase N-terminal domain-containing protein [Marinisporobacter sp.]